MDFENKQKIIKYKNIIKNIEEQCLKEGLKLDLKKLDFDNI